MELRHLRYFIAVAEAGSLTVAAEKKLHTAQPSLSRQIRDLEYEVGVQLISRSVHGIELTAAGRAFLDHARLALTQAEAAKEAARRAAYPARPTFALGFLTWIKIDWLPEAMRVLHDELPNIEVTVSSQNSPDLADDLTRGRLDAAVLRPEDWGRKIQQTGESRPGLAHCDPRLPEAVRPGYHSGSRSGQHYPCGVHDRVNRRRSAAARLPK